MLQQASQFRSLFPYAFGTLLLGIVGLAFGEFALQWQPVPEWVPYRGVLAYLSAALLVAGGGAVLLHRTSAHAALFLAALFGLWVLVMHIPRVVVDPRSVATWLGPAEITALSMGGLTGWMILRGIDASSCPAHVARLAFAVCLAVFGSSHLVYADFTAGMVPAWLPARLFWAYATGAGHLAASLSLTIGVQARLAATLLTAMFASFVLLVHVPRVFGNPGSHEEWVMLAVSLSLTGAAWIFRASLAARRHIATGQEAAPPASSQMPANHS